MKEGEGGGRKREGERNTMGEGWVAVCMVVCMTGAILVTFVYICTPPSLPPSHSFLFCSTTDL